jgi:chromosome transmission fidelity protein 1
VCPYYASRTALPGAEIITLPYPLLLQKSARDALGVKLEGSVVIIDEAHNIMDAVANVHAAEIRLSDLRRGRGMLGVYVKRFGKKLKGVNRVNVGRVGRVIEGLSEWMDGALKFKASRIFSLMLAQYLTLSSKNMGSWIQTTSPDQRELIRSTCLS